MIIWWKDEVFGMLLNIFTTLRNFENKVVNLSTIGTRGLKPKYLSFPWSKLKNHSDHQVEKFLNNYMRITDELVFTQIYSILHLISIQKWKKRLNSERKYRTCDYSLFGADYYLLFQKGPNTNTNIIIRSSIIRIFE